MLSRPWREPLGLLPQCYYSLAIWHSLLCIGLGESIAILKEHDFSHATGWHVETSLNDQACTYRTDHTNALYLSASGLGKRRGMSCALCNHCVLFNKQ